MKKSSIIHIVQIVFLITVFVLTTEYSFAQKCYIIVGAYSSNSNAVNEANKLKENGYPKAGVLSPKENTKLYKVYVDSLGTREQAEQKIKDYRLKFKDAWIYPLANISSRNYSSVNNSGAREIESLKRQLDYYKRSLEKALDLLEAKGSDNKIPGSNTSEEKNQEPQKKSYNYNEPKSSNVFYNKYIKPRESEVDFIAFVKSKTQKSTYTVDGNLKSSDSEVPAIKVKDTPSVSEDQKSNEPPILSSKDQQNQIMIRINNTIDSILEERSKIQTQKIKQLNITIDSLSKENSKNIDHQLAQKKTIDSLSIENLRGRFTFYDSKFSLDIGILRNQVFTTLTQPLLDYFAIKTEKSSYNFYGIQLAGYYHLSPKWSAGINMENYYYNYFLYLFPTLNLKYSTQIMNSPIKISPIIGGGINCVLPLDSLKKSKFADFVKLNGGIDIEMGISNHFSFFATSYYNFCIPVTKGTNLELINYYNFILGLRFNL